MGKQQGLTLVEVLVGLGIMFLIIGAAFTLLHSGMNSYFRGEDRLNQQHELRHAMDMMVRELRQSDSIIASESNQGRITFRLGENKIRYDLEGTTLYRTENNSKQPVTSTVKKLEFQWISGGDSPTGTVKISLEGAGDYQPLSLISEVCVRSYVR